MTTLIDRIIIKYFDVPNETLITNGEKLRQILEAELTAVKGVDELVEKRENTRQTLAYIAGRSVEDAGKYKQIMDCISDLKSLKQTPVASECKHGPLQQCKECEKLLPPCPDCGAIGLHGCVGKIPHGLTDIPTTSNDSKLKEVLLGEDAPYKEDLGCRIYGYVNDGKVNITRVEYTGTRGIG